MIRKTCYYHCATIVAALLGGLLAFPSVARTQPPGTAKASAIPADEKPFWDSAQAFVDAYAKRDASVIGALFTEHAELGGGRQPWETSALPNRRSVRRVRVIDFIGTLFAQGPKDPPSAEDFP